MGALDEPVERVAVGGDRPDAAAGPAAAPPDPETGFIDYHGYCDSLRGWLFCGWIGVKDLSAAAASGVPFRLKSGEGEASGLATVALFERGDLEGRGLGVIVFAPDDGSAAWTPRRLILSIEGAQFGANIGRRSERRAAPALVAALTPLVAERLAPGEAQARFSSLLGRVYLGQDTLTSIGAVARLEIDAAIVCPPDGLLLIGWRLFAAGAVRGVRVRCGVLAAELAFEDTVPMPRPDVVASGVGQELGVEDARCGFKAWLPGCFTRGEPAYLEVETSDGRVAFRTLKVSTLGGLAAIKRLLGDADVRFDELDHAFDKVLGPAVAAFNAERLARPAQVDRIDFGPPPSAPRCSVIVPLYGRMDFLEYQMALFSRRPAPDDVEFIYVLDDPPRRRELENLAQSVHARFQIPFRLLLLEHNVGFAPANNHGLRSARGDHVCFLNSDAFPDTPDWIERLIADLEAHPGVGAIGPRLLFEDGSIQHEGCVYRPLKEFGGWMYVDHDRRGRRPGPERGLRDVAAITGACMMMRRDLAQALGGFDEAFIIGDFEDSDLCKRIIARGLTCAVDRDVAMYHLERQSQTGAQERWRQSLTLYNGWVHQRRWYGADAPAGA